MTDAKTDWVLVPREPTKEMIEAGLRKNSRNPHPWCPAVYRAMLAASPTPPHRDGEGDLVALIEDLRAAAMFWETGGVEKEQTLEWKAADALAAANRQISSYAVEERSLRAERDQWKRVATEDVEALQAIGEEFGILGGENRVSGCRRILTEQRATIESLSRQLEEAREALKPFAVRVPLTQPQLDAAMRGARSALEAGK